MQHPGHAVRLRSSARTHTGRVRDNNEDNIHLWAQNDRVVVATVADGMGGAVAGEEASRIAVEAIRSGLANLNNNHPDAYETIDDDTIIAQLKYAIRNGNNNIIEYANTHPEMKGMGTTLTMAFIRGTQAIIGHVGDSRAYLVDGSDGHVIQITADHSFVQALVAAGHIDEDEVEEHPMKNVLYRALGQAYDVEVDIYYERIRPGDRLVLCSDGLTLHLRSEEIANIALQCEDPNVASQQMIDLANKRGGRDNISVIVVKAEPVAEADHEADVDQDLARYGDFNDEETLLTPTGTAYGPSESDNSPRTDQRKEPPSMCTASHHSKHKQHNGSDTAMKRDQVDQLGEGRDIYTPDQ